MMYRFHCEQAKYGKANMTNQSWYVLFNTIVDLVMSGHISEIELFKLIYQVNYA